jgi:hypothetical protein
LLLQILFSIRSERQLVEQIQYTCSIAGLSAGALIKPPSLWDVSAFANE